MPFHVRITSKSNRAEDEVKLDLSMQQLEERFLIPYREGRSIIIRGRTIPSDDLECIRINYTEETADQLLPIVKAEQFNSSVWTGIPFEWYITKRGKDVTDEFISEPPGNGINPPDIEENKLSRNISHQSFLEKIKNLVSHPLLVLEVVGTIICIITAIRSEDFWIRLSAFIATFGFCFLLLYNMRLWLQSIIMRLTKKFFGGLIIGIVIGAIAMPLVFKPAISSILPLITTHIALVDSTPDNGATLSDINGGMFIRFTEPIPWPYYHFITVHVSPSFPVIVSWSQEHQVLFVTPNKIFSVHKSGGMLNSRFEYDTIYQVKIDGPTLIKPIKIRFHTPKNKI